MTSSEGAAMVFTKRARRKRCRRRRATRSPSEDDDDDPGPMEYVWLPYTVVSLMVLLVSVVAGAVSSLLGDLFLALYGLVCLFLFALTISLLVREARQNIKNGQLKVHRYRKQPFGQAVRHALAYPVISLLLYAPSLLVPTLVFRAEWFAYVVVLIAITPLAFGGYTVIRWWRYRRQGNSEVAR